VEHEGRDGFSYEGGLPQEGEAWRLENDFRNNDWAQTDVRRCRTQSHNGVRQKRQAALHSSPRRWRVCRLRLFDCRDGRHCTAGRDGTETHGKNTMTPPDPAERIGVSGRQAEFIAGSRNWRELFEQHIGNLFFLALLITGDVAAAESALVASLDLPDAETPSGHAVGLDEIKWAVAKSSVALTRPARDWRNEPSPPLPPELQPLLRLDPDLRCCFVLRILARYSHRDCAVLLDLEAEAVKTLVRTALMSLSVALSPASHCKRK
jgi:hypothetical protein